MRRIDGKYHAEIRADGGREWIAIINTATGIEIPEDEPLMLFRAKDWLLRRLVGHYRDLSLVNRCAPEHIAGIDSELKGIEQFAADHPERMKLPD
jgi:hypothetical protein